MIREVSLISVSYNFDIDLIATLPFSPFTF